ESLPFRRRNTRSGLETTSGCTLGCTRAADKPRAQGSRSGVNETRELRSGSSKRDHPFSPFGFAREREFSGEIRDASLEGRKPVRHMLRLLTLAVRQRCLKLSKLGVALLELRRRFRQSALGGFEAFRQ